MSAETYGQLRGAIVAVVGGSTGIGKAVAAACHAAGARVGICGRSVDLLASAQHDLGPDVVAAVADARDEGQLSSFFAKLHPSRLDHIVVSAADFRLASIHDFPYDEVRDLFDDRMRIAYNSVRCSARQLGGSGSITLFSGVLAKRPRIGGAIVSASVSAIEAFARSAALELAPVRVNVVAPGITDTRMLDAIGERCQVIADYTARLPLRRVAEPSDIAQCVMYLMTSRFTTGTTVRIDGGALLV